MVENPLIWLNYNNSAKMSGPKLLHRVIASHRKHLIVVIAIIIRFRGQTVFHTEPCSFEYCFPLYNKTLN